MPCCSSPGRAVGVHVQSHRRYRSPVENFNGRQLERRSHEYSVGSMKRPCGPLLALHAALKVDHLPASLTLISLIIPDVVELQVSGDREKWKPTTTLEACTSVDLSRCAAPQRRCEEAVLDLIFVTHQMERCHIHQSDLDWLDLQYMGVAMRCAQSTM